MEETYTTKAIVLNRQPFRENDLRVAVFSMDYGRLELVARGAKKLKSKQAGHIEPITLAKLMIVRGKQFDYIGSALGENFYAGIKSDLEKICFVGKAVALVKRLVKENLKSEDVFWLLEEFLSVMNQELGIRNKKFFYYFFILKLLSSLGYEPELKNCLKCKKKIEPGNNYFNFKSGGLECGRCSDKNKDSIKISDDCIKVLRLGIGSDFTTLQKLKIDKRLEKEVISAIDGFYRYNFGG
ncbi:DNA repair protein RecO [Candidatus Falkowbacteria bacterium CG11_big_fil_rev_8_21_14_0_20_39_10]|uniref:DNA repair protein RecO n=1 Tax=Candidatus Falkowbacteria bacterium CG11_big_fil_rev_8_21_14_0_20_39_10 TaxID=1974570 RepID=A0A2M6K928_9BACT|nr:MAG: DNA repair protein RecO [Candidatus Falkowbacteria bacterium CG11_big_fil_rev_8_21_14_0_20_39_10]